MLDFGVSFYTIEGGSLDIDTGALQNKLTKPEANDGVATYPLAWFDETTLAIVISGETQAAISIVSIADLSSPVVLSSITVGGFVFAGAVNADGELIVAAVTAVDGPILGLRYNIESGSSFVIDLPGDIQSLDYDSTGTHLLITQFGATVSYVGPDGLRTVPGQFYGASW